MHTYLVRAARLQTAFHHGYEAVALKNLPVRHGPFSLFGIVIYAEAKAVVGIPADGPFNGTLVLCDVTPNNRCIYPVYAVYEELVRQIELCRRVLGNDQKAAGILVYAVHQDAHPFIFRIRSLGYPKVECKGVYKRTAVVAVTGVDHHSGGLVYDHEVIVLIYNVKGNVFREDLQPAALIRHHELYHVLRTDYVIGLCRDIVNQHVPGLNGLLHAAP